MSDFFGKLKSSAGKVAFEAEKMSRLSRARGELEKITGQIQAQYMKLGEMYYTQRGSAGVSGPAYDEICQAIMDLEQQAGAANAEVQRINAEVYTPQPNAPAPSQAVFGAAQPQTAAAQAQPNPAPAQAPTASAASVVAKTTKFCPNCGREMPVESKFCPDCGTKM